MNQQLQNLVQLLDHEVMRLEYDNKSLREEVKQLRELHISTESKRYIVKLKNKKNELVFYTFKAANFEHAFDQARIEMSKSFNPLEIIRMEEA